MMPAPAPQAPVVEWRHLNSAHWHTAHSPAPTGHLTVGRQIVVRVRHFPPNVRVTFRQSIEGTPTHRHTDPHGACAFYYTVQAVKHHGPQLSQLTATHGRYSPFVALPEVTR